MAFWNWAGMAVLLGLYGVTVVVLLRWLRERLDRKAREVSYHAERLLEQADVICSAASAMEALAKNSPGSERCRRQASVLWAAGSASSLLSVWAASAWILDRHRRLRPLRNDFVKSVDSLCQAALIWHGADLRWREVKGLTESEAVIDGPDINPLPEAQTKRVAAAACFEACQCFLAASQMLHDALQAYVREDMICPERTADKTQE